MKPSHHLLRRTARAKKDRLDRLVQEASTPDWDTSRQARQALARLGIERLTPKPVFVVQRAERGPWRWRVVQLP